MSNFTDKFMEGAGRFGSQKHMVAIRDSFATMMPLMLAGSIAVLINALPGIINGMAGTSLALPKFITSINGAVWSGSFGLISLYIVILLSYNLAKAYDTNALGAMVAAVSSFIAVASTDYFGWTSYGGTMGLLMGIFIAIGAVEIFRRLANVKAFVIKMPEGVPPAVARSFAALIPNVLTLFIFGAIGILFQTIAFNLGAFATETLGDGSIKVVQTVLDDGTIVHYGKSLFALVNSAIQEPMNQLANSLGTAIVIVLLVHVMWLLGLHGPNILEGPIQTIFLGNMTSNMQHFEATGSAITAPFIITKPFLDTFVYLGGSGVTLGLLIAIFLVGRSKTFRLNAKLSIGPGAFNINEPVIFGMPIVLNPLFAVPFVLAPVVLTIISYFAMYFHLVSRTVVITFWATPPIISGLLATGGDWRACVLQVINLVISVAIYLPFVAIADKQECKKEAAFAAKNI